MTTVMVDEGITAVDDGFLIALYVFGAVGALFVLRFVSRALGGFYRYCLRCDPGLRKRYAGANWAVVTGATDGIGKAEAFRLASLGFNVALVSRTQAKLDTVADELMAKYPGTQTRVLAARFGSDDKTCVPRCEALIRELGADLAVLVNNVGIGDPLHHFWMTGTEGTRPTPDSYDVELEVNCRVATRLTVAALQVMIPAAYASKARRGILVTGSISYMGMPLASVYGGTKAYVDILMKGVHTEVVNAGHPVDVTIHHPGPVATNMTASLIPADFNNLPQASYSTPAAVAKGALSALGHNDMVTFAIAKHALMCWATPPLNQSYKATISALTTANKANGLSKTLGGLVGGGAAGAAAAAP